MIQVQRNNGDNDDRNLKPSHSIEYSMAHTFLFTAAVPPVWCEKLASHSTTAIVAEHRTPKANL